MKGEQLTAAWTGKKVALVLVKGGLRSTFLVFKIDKRQVLPMSSPHTIFSLKRAAILKQFNSSICAIGFSHSAVVFVFLLAMLASGRTLLAQGFSESFDGNALNADRWQKGSTLTTDSVTLADGKVRLATSSTASGSVVLLTQAGNFNPFTETVSIEIKDISMTGLSNGGYALSAFVGIGRYESDMGGLIDSELAAKYTANGGNYAEGGGALSVAVCSYGENNPFPWRIQVLDQGTKYAAATPVISDKPDGLTFIVDGASSTYRVVLKGAVFTENGSDTYSGTFSNFTAEALNVSGNDVCRVSFGVTNGFTTAEGITASIGEFAVDIEPLKPGDSQGKSDSKLSGQK